MTAPFSGGKASSSTVFSDLSSSRRKPEPPVLIDIVTLAARLGVTPRFIRRLIAERRILFLKIGKFIRFDPGEIDSWIDRQRINPN